MVSVPVTDGSAREVQARGQGRFRYAKTEDQVGSAVARFGDNLADAADTWDAIEATHDEADALKISNELAKYERERLKTGEDAYLTTQGFNASDGRDAAMNDLNTAADNLLGGARSERARKMAERAIAVRLGNAETTIADHATKQVGVARDQQSQARLDSLADDAIDARGTEQFAVSLGVAEVELRQRGGREGWGADKTDDEVAKYKSNVISRTALAMDAEDGEATAALAFVEAQKDDLLPGDEARITAALAPRVDAAWASDILASGVLNGYLMPDVVAEGADDAPASEPITLDVPFSGDATTVEGGRYGAARSYGGHSGVDYAGLPAGTSVPPAGSGTVVYSGERDGYGHRVEVDHGLNEKGQRITTSYSHLDARKVKVGDAVGAESDLGGVGSSGGAYGTHLHFEVMVDGVKVDPATIDGMKITPGAGGASPETIYDSAAMREAVDRYVASNPDISERRKQALYAAAERSVGLARADRAQAEGEADRKLMDWLTNNVPDADGLTSESQIPAALLQGASPSARASISSRIQATSARKQARADAAAAKVAADAEAAAVFELYSLTDEELAATDEDGNFKVDLRKYKGRIDIRRMGPWVDRQQRLVAGGPVKVVSSDRIAKKIDTLGKPYGASRGPNATPEERKNWMNLRAFVEQRVAGKADDEVTDEVLRGMVGAGMATVEAEGTGWIWNDKVTRSSLAPGAKFSADIPDDVRAEIKAELTARGRPADEEAVADAYAAGRARGLY